MNRINTSGIQNSQAENKVGHKQLVESLILPQNTNNVLHDNQTQVIERVKHVIESFRRGVFDVAQPQFGHMALWLEQFFGTVEAISFSSNFSANQYQPSVGDLMSHIHLSNPFSQYSLNDNLQIPPSFSWQHRLVADYLFASGVNNPVFPSLVIPGVESPVFNWDTSVMYSGQGGEYYNTMLAGTQKTYNDMYLKLNRLYEMFMYQVSAQLVPQLSDETFTSGLLFIGPSQLELDRIASIQASLNSSHISVESKRMNVVVMTQSLNEMQRAADWSASHPEVNVSILGYDVRDLQQHRISSQVVNRGVEFRLDAIMKGLTSGNFSEEQFVTIIQSLTQPDDKFYFDFQSPKYTNGILDMEDVANAYRTEDMIRFFSYNFKIYLQRLGVKSEWLVDFENNVKVSVTPYENPDYNYAQAVINHVNLSNVNPDITKFLADSGYDFPDEVVLCRSIRREKEGFQAFLKTRGINVYHQNTLRCESGNVNSFVVGREN